MNSVLQERLKEYECTSAQEEQNAASEITQELVLYALYEAHFFEIAAFQGGTALRILHKLNRFSEDLDFSLITPSDKFDLNPYIQKVSEALKAYGFNIRITGKDKIGSVHNRFLKEDSIGNILEFNHIDKFIGSIHIKVEVDTNPPLGAVYETAFVDFPLDFAVRSFDRASLFSGKSHALLCREYIKGRDWYDFSWYVSKKTQINFDLLRAALDQSGPWKNKKIVVDKKWYLRELKRKIATIDWEKAKNDVKRFLKNDELKTLELWSAQFFNAKVDILSETLK